MNSLKFERLFLFIFLGSQCSLLTLISPPGFAGQISKSEGEQASDGLEMIATRMQKLSQSLNKMPEPPVMNQTLEIPHWETRTASKAEAPLQSTKKKSS